MQEIDINGVGMKTILVLCDWFEPGFKAGGPIRSCVNFARSMKFKYNIFVLTTDRDIDENRPYDGVTRDEWTTFEDGIKIMYCSPEQLTWGRTLDQIKEISPEFIYLNSMYSKHFSVYPILMKRLRLYESKIVLAPRGMLARAALNIKNKKKVTFLRFFRLFGLHRLVHFHATDRNEVKDIQRVFGKNVNITQVLNFPSPIAEAVVPIEKKAGSLKLLYISRIHPIKNLYFLLSLLAEIQGQISVEIVGAQPDKNYLARCEELIQRLPQTINTNIRGEVPFDAIAAILNQHHLFVLPSLGENFGHVIFEALSHGRPVVISDKTPWSSLQSVAAGYALPLDDKAGFINAIQHYVDMEQEEYDRASLAARKYSNSYRNPQSIQNKYIDIFA